ncbi:MAG: hypothetical protein HFI63_01485 [Lachnospiraceae bacterium]|nr:hypothetical protein [Lachnospiraceae bacterium]
MKKLRYIILFICIGMMSGCGKKENADIVETNHIAETNETTSENASLSFEAVKAEGHIEKQLTDGVLLDAEAIFPKCEMDEVKSCSIKTGAFNGKELAAKLFPQIGESEWEYPDYSAIGAESTALYWGDFFLGETKMEGHIAIGVNLNFATKHWLMCEAMFPVLSINGSIDDKGNELNEEFEFATREETERTAKEYLEKNMGLSGLEIVRTYSMNHQQMQEQYEKHLSDPELQEAGKEGEFTLTEWTKEEDCYWLVMEQGINGIPILRQSYTRQDELGLPTGGVEMGYTSFGLEYIKISNVFEIIEEESVRLAELATVLEALEKKFEMSFSENMIIDEMKLIYFPYPRSADFEYDLIPAWEFRVKQENYIGYVYVDAVSGKEIVE